MSLDGPEPNVEIKGSHVLIAWLVALAAALLYLAGGRFWNLNLGEDTSICLPADGTFVRRVMATPVRSMPDDLLVAFDVLDNFFVVDERGGGLLRGGRDGKLLEHFLERVWLNEMSGLPVPPPQTVGDAIEIERKIEATPAGDLLALRERAFTAVLQPVPAASGDLPPAELAGDPQRFRPVGANVWHGPDGPAWGTTYILIALENRTAHDVFLPNFVGLLLRRGAAGEDIELSCPNKLALPSSASDESDLRVRWRKLAANERMPVLCAVADPGTGRNFTVDIAHRALQALEGREAWVVRPATWYQERWKDRVLELVDRPLGVEKVLRSQAISAKVKQVLQREAKTIRQEKFECFPGGGFTAFLGSFFPGFLAGAVLFSILHFARREWSLKIAYALSGLLVTSCVGYLAWAAYDGLMRVGLGALEFMLLIVARQGIGALLGIWLMYGAFAYLLPALRKAPRPMWRWPNIHS